MPPSPPAALVELAHAYAVATEFWDWQGRHRPVAEATIRAVLAALGVACADDAEVEASARQRRDRERSRVLPEVLVRPRGREHDVPLRLPEHAGYRAALRLEEGGSTRLWAAGPGAVLSTPEGALREHRLVVPADLPLGWHELVVEADGRRHTMPLVLTPARLELPDHLQPADTQSWGLMTQLYAMRSRASWGIGDLADLADLGAWAAEQGADFVLVNPLHAAEPVAPMEPSPYLPTTRRFVNPVYLRVEDVPEVAYLRAAERQLVEWHADDAQRQLAQDHIDRDAVWETKRSALRLVHRQPRSLRRERAFAAFRQREGQGLVDFATWCVLAETHGTDWHTWPEPLRDPRSAEAAAVRGERAEDVDLHCWLQWVLADQLARVQDEVLAAGMRIGVVHDLAVGVHPDGADAWALGPALARGVTVGAPADQYNQLGQDWSQPPWRPDRLAELGYTPYRDMLRAVLRDAGGLRVDHVIGLFRLWWIPQGLSPHEGTYVRYDHDAMVGILLLEAHRAGALVIGEDLGTVEPWVRDYLRERGVLGTSILWFERDYEREEVLAPERYRELCLATVTTHDLPPTAGYLAGAHIDLRHELGLLDRPLEEEQEADRAYREDVLAAVRREGLLREGADVGEQVEALHRFLARSPARLLGVSVSDLAQDTRIINQPGTDEEYPNWRVPLAGPDGSPLLLEELVGLPSARWLARAVAREP